AAKTFKETYTDKFSVNEGNTMDNLRYGVEVLRASLEAKQSPHSMAMPLWIQVI
ncbi:hypothetical protein MMC12_008702, partial [Toensbergia leucococca]|nr:hypothetical protein [Toensbergia leucococca]